MKQKKSGKEKKAVSIMIGYVLLVVLAIVLGVIVYNILKTYIPHDEIDCPEGTSLLIESYTYDCNANILTFDLVNNGRFNVDGYFIYATDEPNQKVATIVISNNNSDDGDSVRVGNLEVKLGTSSERNEFSPGDRAREIYNLEGSANQIYSIEILPAREDSVDERKMLVTCKAEIIKKDIQCT